MKSPLEQFAEAVQRPDDEIPLDAAACLIGAIGNPDLGSVETFAFQGVLDGFAAQIRQARERLPDANNSPWEIARGISQTLFRELGFRGNSVDYYNPDNSFLLRVVETRLGIPITLSVLYIEIARRLGVTARGVGFPGHFLVRVESENERLFIDPFHGGIELDTHGLTKLLEQRNGPGARVEHAMLEPITKNNLLRRMLFNLAGIYGQRNDWKRSLAVLERLFVLDPTNPRIERELTDLRARLMTLN